jgi:hypothetical protein
VVQIPNQKNIDTIVKALDYNAKLFYRLYEFTSCLPSGANIDDEFNINSYQKIVPFSPHTIEETIEFEDRLKKFYLKNLKKITKKIQKIWIIVEQNQETMSMVEDCIN